MERLSSLDEVFLAIESPRTPMNIGSVAIFDGPTPPLDDIRALLMPRLAQVPRCRQRVREPKGPFGRPVWIDDVGFDIRHHLQALSIADRHDDDFDDLVAELLATPLDRRHPLWRMWIVDGAQTNRWAAVVMVHHCLVDGVAGNDLLTALLTPDRPRTSEPHLDRFPAPEPSVRRYVAFEVSQALRSTVFLFRGATTIVAHPHRSWTRARNTITAAKRLWYRQHHAPTSLVGPIGMRRHWMSSSIPLSDIASIQAAFGCTVNDVVVAAVAAGFRELLMERGESVDGRSVTALVPVSLRATDERSGTGNRVANVHAHLPMDVDDPVSRLHQVRAHLADLKVSHEVDATALLMNVGNYVPRFIADRIARTVVERQRNVETTITNVPGPRRPLFLGTHRMVEGYPVAPIAGLVRTTVAVWSYCDTLNVGLTGDSENVPDLATLSRAITRGFTDLLAVARESGRSS